MKLKSAYLGIKDECPEAYFHSPVNYVMLRTLTRTDYHLQKVTWSKIIMSVPSSAVKWKNKNKNEPLSPQNEPHWLTFFKCNFLGKWNMKNYRIKRESLKSVSLGQTYPGFWHHVYHLVTQCAPNKKSLWHSRENLGLDNWLCFPARRHDLGQDNSSPWVSFSQSIKQG